MTTPNHPDSMMHNTDPGPRSSTPASGNAMSEHSDLKCALIIKSLKEKEREYDRIKHKTDIFVATVRSDEWEEWLKNDIDSCAMSCDAAASAYKELKKVHKDKLECQDWLDQLHSVPQRWTCGYEELRARSALKTGGPLAKIRDRYDTDSSLEAETQLDARLGGGDFYPEAEADRLAKSRYWIAKTRNDGGPYSSSALRSSAHAQLSQGVVEDSARDSGHEAYGTNPRGTYSGSRDNQNSSEGGGHEDAREPRDSHPQNLHADVRDGHPSGGLSLDEQKYPAQNDTRGNGDRVQVQAAGEGESEQQLSKVRDARIRVMEAGQVQSPMKRTGAKWVKSSSKDNIDPGELLMIRVEDAPMSKKTDDFRDYRHGRISTTQGRLEEAANTLAATSETPLVGTDTQRSHQGEANLAASPGSTGAVYMASDSADEFVSVAHPSMSTRGMKPKGNRFAQIVRGKRDNISLLYAEQRNQPQPTDEEQRNRPRSEPIHVSEGGYEEESRGLPKEQYPQSMRSLENQNYRLVIPSSGPVKRTAEHHETITKRLKIPHSEPNSLQKLVDAAHTLDKIREPITRPQLPIPKIPEYELKLITKYLLEAPCAHEELAKVFGNSRTKGVINKLNKARKLEDDIASLLKVEFDTPEHDNALREIIEKAKIANKNDLPSLAAILHIKYCREGDNKEHGHLHWNEKVRELYDDMKKERASLQQLIE